MVLRSGLETEMRLRANGTALLMDGSPYCSWWGGGWGLTDMQDGELQDGEFSGCPWMGNSQVSPPRHLIHLMLLPGTLRTRSRVQI